MITIFSDVSGAALTKKGFHTYGRIMEQFGLEGTLKIPSSNSPAMRHLQQDHIAQCPIKPDCGHLQG